MSTAIAQYRNEAEWLEERKRGIGGSDVAAIFGLHPFKSQQEVWREKTGRAGEKPATPDMLRGRALEDVAVQLYEKRTGRKTRRQPLKRMVDFPFLLASIDRQVFAKDDFGTSCLEVKCPRSRNFFKWKREGLPDYIVLQGQMEALVWGYEHTEFAIFGADDFELLTFPVPFDANVSRRIIEVCGDWWHTYVEGDKEPPDNVPIPTLKGLPEVAGEMEFRTDAAFVSAAQDYIAARDLEAEAAAVKDEARTRIIQVIEQKFGKYEARDLFRVYYSEQKGKAQHAETLKSVRMAKPLDRTKVAEALFNFYGIIPEQLLEKLKGCDLNFSEHERVGATSKTLNVFALRAQQGE